MIPQNILHFICPILLSAKFLPDMIDGGNNRNSKILTMQYWNLQAIFLFIYNTLIDYYITMISFFSLL